MNEPTEVGATNELLRRRWGIQGGQGPILTFATDGFPFVALDQELMDAENLFLNGARRAAATRLATPAGGQIASAGIFSPPGGNTIAILERIVVVGANAAGRFELRQQSPGVQAITGTVAGTLLDSRWGAALSTCLMGTASTAAAFGSIMATLEASAAGVIDIPWEYVIAPGGQFTIQGPVDDNFQATFVWRERRLGTWENA